VIQPILGVVVRIGLFKSMVQVRREGHEVTRLAGLSRPACCNAQPACYDLRMLVKKYGNRRLYDTESSRYITLDDLTTRIREGSDVRVIDAKTNDDLTQETLTQIIIEGRGADRIFPATLLHQLIRLGDDALSDFLGRYVQGALELYLQARKATQTFMPFNPMLTLFNQQPPFAQPGWTSSPMPAQQAPPGTALQAVSAAPGAPTDVETLRRELDELKASLRKRRK
jgi:polyhydroxyalkanoate synthesis repressor PhaR